MPKGALSTLRTLVEPGGLIRSSATILVGNGAARLLGFLFAVAAARLLLPRDYGLFAYALTIATIASTFVTNAPIGLARYLVRYRDRPDERNAYYSNWLAVVGATLLASCALALPGAILTGLNGWLSVAVLSVILGVAVFETLRQVLLGLEAYVAMTTYWVVANALELVLVLALAAAGRRNAAIYLAVYGLSTVVAVPLILPFVRTLPRLVRSSLSKQKIAVVARYWAPLLFQTAFYSVWFGIDLIVVQQVISRSAAGNYAAAKTLGAVVVMAPQALGSGLVPGASRVARGALRRYLATALGISAVVIIPVAIGMALLALPLTVGVFGSRYPMAAGPLPVIAFAMAMSGFYTIFESVMWALGRPHIDAIATGVGMVCTVALAVTLTPSRGLIGAAVAFAAGSTLKLLVLGSYAAWGIFIGASARLGHFDEERTVPANQGPRQASVRATILLIAEELDQRTDEGYAKFTREVGRVLSEHHSVLTHITEVPRDKDTFLARGICRLRALLSAAHSPAVIPEPPAIILYASRSSATVAALVRARLLKLTGRGARVAMVALQPREAALASPLPLRWLRPDLLLVGTERERVAAVRRGMRAECIWGGVDLDRFRPAAGGEREALRRKWGLTAGDRILLHVGHLREGRNLSALQPLAAVPGTTVLVVASTQRGPESERIKDELVRSGVTVLEGYQPQVEELYRLADCYVFPPVSTDHAIAMPLSVLEAMASGLPVVSMRFGAMAERFENSAAVRFVDSPQELVQKALEPQTGMPESRRLAESYSWEGIGERLDRLLRDLLNA
jgi:O-antigen/teichoic acid export membrane protein/glycosyltransferase involved in cell wall biosynthesis